MPLNSFTYWITLSTGLGSGLIAGVFFAFSVFVMSALARLPAAQGIAAMQSINITVINPWFLTVFIGTALGSVTLLVLAFVPTSPSNRSLLVMAAIFYLLGTILVTGMANVPRNDALASVAPASAEAANLWADYLSTWTRWNHVRTFFSFAASAAFGLSLRYA